MSEENKDKLDAAGNPPAPETEELDEAKKAARAARAERDAERAKRMAERKAKQAAAEAAKAAENVEVTENVEVSENAEATKSAETAKSEATSAVQADGEEEDEAKKAAREARAARDAERAKRMAERKAKQAAEEAAKAGDGASGDGAATEQGNAAGSTEGGAPAGDAAAARAERDAARAKRMAERKAAQAAESEAVKPKEPSPNQPRLDRLVALIQEHIGQDAIEEAYINEPDRHLPVIVMGASRWEQTSRLLKDHAELKLSYLRNVSGVDLETHMEVVYHLLSLDTKHDYCVKVKTDRDQPSVPSVTPLWATANWNEREIYDLLGIDFPGHPDLRRIMMSDDWVGHPLRKDYEPIDPEV